MKNKKYVKERISVVIPLYGSFDEKKAILTAESALRQKNIDVEVVIAEEGVKPKLNNVLPNQVKHIFTYFKQSENISDYNPGSSRNGAISIATGEFIYTNDADVLFLNKNYLSNLVEILIKFPDLSLQRPPMRRLPLEEFSALTKVVKKKGLENAIQNLDFSQEFIATITQKKYHIKSVHKLSEGYLKTFTIDKKNYDKFMVNREKYLGYEPTIWSENLHVGGNIFYRHFFDEVGGYCENYVNWGCEDSDLQWKLSKISKLAFIPKTKDFEVLHLDHPKGYFSSEMWKKNEEISIQRMNAGYADAIKKDLKRFGQKWN